MRRLSVLLLVAGTVVLAYWLQGRAPQPGPGDAGDAGERDARRPPGAMQSPILGPDRAVLDISVHTLEELRVLFERAGELATQPRPPGQEASIVLVLHGPEVDFFAIRNYNRYKEIVDEAARLDAFDVVDIRICQTMMEARGIGPDEIPSFIEQVPYGPGEVERLVEEGYLYF